MSSFNFSVPTAHALLLWFFFRRSVIGAFWPSSLLKATYLEVALRLNYNYYSNMKWKIVIYTDNWWLILFATFARSSQINVLLRRHTFPDTKNISWNPAIFSRPYLIFLLVTIFIQIGCVLFTVRVQGNFYQKARVGRLRRHERGHGVRATTIHPFACYSSG